MHDAVAVTILVCWVAFWLYWLAAAVATKEERPGGGQWARFAGFRVLFVVVMVVLLRGRGIHNQAPTGDPWRQAVGSAMFVLGLAVAIWARGNIGRNWGMPMNRKQDGELVTTGPYRLIRHPIYSGILLAMAGTAVAVAWYWLIVVAVTGAYFIFSATREERYMLTQFPDSYPEYKQTTKMLVPYVF